MKKIFLVLLLATSLLTPSLIVAKDNNKATSDIGQKTAAKLEKIQERVASPSAKNKDRKKEGNSKGPHVVGVIVSINLKNISLKTNRDTKTILTTAATKYLQLDHGKKTISHSDLKVNDRIAVYGIGKNDSSGTAKLIALLGSKVTQRRAIFGRIESILGNKIVVEHLIKATTLGTIVVDSKTLIKSKSTTISLAKFKIGDVIVASGTVDSSGNILASLVHLLPGVGLRIKTATSSATP